MVQRMAAFALSVHRAVSLAGVRHFVQAWQQGAMRSRATSAAVVRNLAMHSVRSAVQAVQKAYILAAQRVAMRPSSPVAHARCGRSRPCAGVLLHGTLSSRARPLKVGCLSSSGVRYGSPRGARTPGVSNNPPRVITSGCLRRYWAPVVLSRGYIHGSSCARRGFDMHPRAQPSRPWVWGSSGSFAASVGLPSLRSPLVQSPTRYSVPLPRLMSLWSITLSIPRERLEMMCSTRYYYQTIHECRFLLTYLMRKFTYGSQDQYLQTFISEFNMSIMYNSASVES